MYVMGKIQHEEVRDNSTLAEQGLINALESLTEKKERACLDDRIAHFARVNLARPKIGPSYGHRGA